MSEIDELRKEIQQLKRMNEDTNQVVHGMRRRQRWHTLFQIVWWLTIVGVTGAAYYYYVQPYVAQVMETYGNAKDFQVQVQDWFAEFGRNGTQ